MAKCKICKKEFDKRNLAHVVCSFECMFVHINNEKQKKWNTKKKKLKEGLETYSDVLKKTQTIFNKYIRLRDKDKPCISCLKPLKSKFDAGHFLSVKQNNIVRFDENNVHGQCVHCNRDLHGNLINYQQNLIDRIGQEKFNILLNNLNKTKKYTIFELKELQEYYASKCKE